MTATAGEPSARARPDGSQPRPQHGSSGAAPDVETARPLRRRALSIGVSRFAPHPEYGVEDDDEPDDLSFARDRVAALKKALEHEAFGYVCTTLTSAGAGESTVDDPGPTAAALGAALRETLTESPGDDVLIVHVLSHGVPRTTGLYALGSDSAHLPETSVDAWLAAVEDFPGRPAVLFLLDLCHAGQAARRDWQLRTLDGSNRAWVMAAAGESELAVDGRFTQAVAEVLNDIAEKRIQFDHGRRFIDYYWFVGEVESRVKLLAADRGGLSQRVTAIAADRAARDLPFLPNPCHDSSPLNRVRGEIGARLSGELGAFLDEVADLAHFRRHAQGGAGFPEVLRAEGGRGLFTGRATETARLADWLEDETASRLCVVTGSPGAGKSALIGVLLCAAHPRLRTPTESLWEPLGRSVTASSALAAVHARQRTLREMVDSLARQLDLRPAGPNTEAPTDWTVEELIDALRRLAGPPPVVIVDALDEMRYGREAVRTLLQPIGTAVRPDGRPVCRLLLGARNEEPFTALVETARTSGDLVDLDDTRREYLEKDLREYIVKLLTAALQDAAPGGPSDEAVAGFAATTARALADAATGSFLMAALYASYALQDSVRQRLVDPAAARKLGSEVPLTLPGLLDLSFGQDHAHQLLRPVLAALAFAQGDGMPVSAVTAVARVFASGTVRVDAAVVGQLLDDVRAFLRSVADRDGTMLHGLLHKSVADELRLRPVPTDQQLSDTPGVLVHEALLRSLRDDPDGRPAWGALHGYPRRHLAQHAVDAGRFDELCTDPEFLVHADPDWLVPELRHAVSEPARSAAAVYRTSAHLHRRVEAEQRRHILALDAVRHEARTLADRLADPVPGTGSPMLWRPSWATGSRISAAHAFTLQVPDDRVTALAAATIDEAPLVVTGSRNGKVRVWNTRTGRQHAWADPRSGEIQALVCTRVEGATVLLSAGSGGALTLWDLPALTARSLPLDGHTATVRALACGEVVDSPSALTADESGRLLLWDLSGDEPVSTLRLPRSTNRVTALALVQARDGARTPVEQRSVLAIAVNEPDHIRFWSLVTEEELGPGIRHPSQVNALVTLTARGAEQLVTAGKDGHVRLWNARTHELTSQSAAPHDGPVYALACVTGTEGVRILSGGSDGTIRSWDPEEDGRQLSEINRFVGHMGAVTALAHPESDPPVVVSAGTDPVLWVWNVPWERQRTSMPVGHTSWVTALTVAELPERVLLASAGADGHIHRWDLADGTPYGTPLTPDPGPERARTPDTRPVHALTTTHLDGRPVLASGGADGHIHRWDLADGTPYGTPFATGTGPVHALTTTRLDGRPVLLSGGADGLLLCWDAASGRRRGLPFAGHSGGVNAVAGVDLGGRPTAVSCGDDGTLRIWDLWTGLAARAPVAAHQGWATALACTELDDGTAVAVTGGQDGLVRVWDLANGTGLTEPLRVTGGVNAVACGAVGGTPVVVAADDCAVRVWDLASGRLRENIGVPGTVPTLLLRGQELVLGCEWEVVVLRRRRTPED
ncbi:AAA family ATPase [Streptomyces sp. NPDC048751]|uniref:AAA family ATPase n=1 Tax=Streptomyces sp. NPDC048751 TaxID=3365591 RepID=UPI003724A95C